jgi:hypothetical protein
MKNIKQDNREIKEIKIIDLAKHLATQKAEIIDSQIIPFIPKWQLKLIKDERFRLTHRLFGYKLDVEHNMDYDTYIFKRYGKILNQFIIRTVIKT